MEEVKHRDNWEAHVLFTFLAIVMGLSRINFRMTVKYKPTWRSYDVKVERGKSVLINKTKHLIRVY